MSAALVSVLLVATAIAACSTGTASPVASAATTEPTAKPTLSLATASAAIDETPTAAPTKKPTPSPAFDATDVGALCVGKGPGIEEADAFSGTEHGVIAIDYFGADNTSIMGAAGPAESIQLVLCASQPTLVKTGSCGMYKRSSDGKVGYVYKYKQARTLTVYSIKTGKKVTAKTLYGASASCSQSFDIQFSSPPWKVSGGPVSDQAILDYANVISRMKAK
jgi:hypothetical protein